TRLEISSNGIEPSINDYDPAIPSPSGLRLTDLTGRSQTVRNQRRGVLSLDDDGDVIWVEACCSSNKTKEDELTDRVNKLEAKFEQMTSELKTVKLQNQQLKDQMIKKLKNTKLTAVAAVLISILLGNNSLSPFGGK